MGSEWARKDINNKLNCWYFFSIYNKNTWIIKFISIYLTGNILSIIYIITAILSPVFGYLADKYGNRANLLALSSLIFVIS